MFNSKIKLTSPKLYQDVDAKFIISGSIPKSWLKDDKYINDRLSLEFIDIDGKTFMGASLHIKEPVNWLLKVQRRLYFSEIAVLVPENIGFLEHSEGRITIKISGQDEDTQSVFIPIVVTQFVPTEGASREIIDKHREVGKMIKKYREDLIEYYKELSNLQKSRDGKDRDLESGEYNDIGDLYLSSTMYGLLQGSEDPTGVYIYEEENRKEYELNIKYKSAIEWRGPLAGATVGRLDGYHFRVYSNDHDKHFHVIHRGRGIDARFSFPEIELINYKSSENVISSKDKARIQDYFKNPQTFSAMQYEFDRRDSQGNVHQR